jgi:hypothetical protein
MSKPILDPQFWKHRLSCSGEDQRYHAVYRCPPEEWTKIEDRHREILAKHIKPEDHVLDAGCGWGRLVDLFPPTWDGYYLGIDLSPDFIDIGRKERGSENVMFVTGEFKTLLPSFNENRFDWAVCVSIKKMVRDNLGDKVWNEIEEELTRVARKVLILEYSDGDYNRGQILTASKK